MVVNRRKDLRVRASFRVRFKTMDELVLAYAGNLSRGGMRLRTEAPLPIGSVVQVNIELPDGQPELAVRCEVVVVTPEPKTDRHYLGVKFLDPRDETKKRLEWYILNSDPVPGQIGSQHGVVLDLLIVEDDKLQLDAIAAPFKVRGDRVTTAANGIEGLAASLKQSPNVILSDVQMPKMDGWQFLRAVRSRANLRHVPFIFLTTLSGERERLMGYRLGVDDYIAKPPDPRDLVARVDRAAVRTLQMSQESSKKPPEVSSDALRGDLEQVGLPSILSFLEMERKTGVLRVGPQVNALLFLKEGRPLQVTIEGAENLRPRERAFRLLDVNEGRFEFTPTAVDVQDELKAAVNSLLLEHATRQDEGLR